MDPTLVQALMATHEGRELKDYLKRLIVELDSVIDVEANSSEMYAVEVRARVLAIKKLNTALSTLLDTDNRDTIKEPNQYVTY